MRDSIKTALAPFFALLLIGTAILGAPTAYVGTAEAAHGCSFGAALKFTLLNTATPNPTNCEFFHGDTSASSGADEDETKTNLVTASAGAADHVRTYTTTSTNYVTGSRPVARAEALSAYYAALENGSTKSQARTKAHQAIEDFYATIQFNAVQSWNTLALNWVDYENTEDSEGLPDDFVAFATGTDFSTESAKTSITGAGDYSYTMVNNSAVTIKTVQTSSGITMNPAPGAMSGAYDWRGYVAAENDSYTTAETPQMARYRDTLQDTGNESTAVKDGIDTYINETYDAYQQGTINATEIAGPNALARDYAAEGDFQSWAVLRLSHLDGADPPANLSTTGKFRIDSGLNTYEGILLSAENPPSGAFEAGTTYNSSNLNGSQLVVTSNKTVNLTGEWTLESITDDEGNQVQNATIRNINYSTANTSDYQNLIDRMEELRAEIDAREDAVGGGGGLLGGTFGTIGQLAALAIVAGGGYVVLNNRSGGSGGGGNTTINVQERMKARRDRKDK